MSTIKELEEIFKRDFTPKISQRDKIEEFLTTYFKIGGNYTISDDGIVDIDGDIELIYQKFNQDGFTELPIQFGYISNYFDFERSLITTLKGFPHRRNTLLKAVCYRRNVLMKSVHYTVADHCSINYSRYLKSLEFSPQCLKFHCDNCDILESLSKKCTDGISTLDGLNCEYFFGENLNLEKIGTNFYAKEFRFNNFPTPTALKKHTEFFSMLNEIMYLNNKKPLFKYISTMRQFIQLNPQFRTVQKESWVMLIKNYHKHKDLFRFVRKDTLVS